MILRNVKYINILMTDSIPEMFDSNTDSWEVIDSYFKENGLHQIIQHQLESFNDFISSDIQDIISQNNPVINYDYVPEVENTAMRLI